MTMINSSFDTSGLQFAWDSTSIKTASECLFKYKLKHLDGWRSEKKSVHLRFGAIYASSLELFHKNLAFGMGREDAIIASVEYALVESWDYAYKDVSKIGDPGFRIPGSGKPWDSGHATKTRSTLIRSIVWYFEHFKEDLETVILDGGTPAVEYSFALPVTEDLVFCGHIDKLVTHGGQYMILDQKTTTSTVGDYFFDQFSPDTQVSMYTFAGNIIFNLPIKGLLIDAAQIAAGFTRFERGFIPRTDSQLTEWYRAALDTIERARSATRKGFFPQNDTACGNYGGCEFRRICSKSPDVRDKFLAVDFTKGPTWDPIKPR